MTAFYHDFETYSELDVRDVGAEAYARHPSTQVLMMAYAFDDGPVNIWVPAEGEPGPQWINEIVADPNITFHAFNAPFERAIWRHVLGYDLPPEKFRCTMTEAYALSFAGSLADVGVQIGLPEEQMKDPKGGRLINRFSKPAPRNHKAYRYDQFSHPDEWEDFKRYCKQDVEAERAIHWFCEPYRPMSAQDWSDWALDQHINDLGIPVDLGVTDAAIDLHQEAKARLLDHMREWTGLDNPNSRDQLLGWLRNQGVRIDDLQAGTLDAYCRPGGMIPCEEWALPGIDTNNVVRVLDAKRRVGMTAPTKWKAYREKACADDRLRGMFVHRGASRTARDASRLVNMANLKRPKFADMDTAANVIRMRSVETVEALYGDPIEFLASTVRGGVTVPPGKKLVVADFASIESRMVGWLSDCKAINDAFAAGRDTYKDLASDIFNVPYEAVTKEQRFFSKPASLGGQYRLGAKGLQAYAEQFGVTLTEDEADHHIQTFRNKYHEIVSMWKWLDAAVRNAIEYGTIAEGYKVKIYVEGAFLFIDLPRGRRLSYYQPRMEMRKAPWGDMIPQFTYMGQEQETRQWARLSAHSGLITENICQAVSRDVLFDAMQRVWARCPQIILHVYDEIGLEVAKQYAFDVLQKLIAELSQPISWAPGLLLSAAGYTAQSYRKD